MNDWDNIADKKYRAGFGDGVALLRLNLEVENKRLTEQLRAANARERPAFEAGYEAGGDDCRTGDMDEWGERGVTKYTEDREQAWQQYRCQDDSDWKASTEHTQNQGEDTQDLGR